MFTIIHKYIHTLTQLELELVLWIYQNLTGPLLCKYSENVGLCIRQHGDTLSSNLNQIWHLIKQVQEQMKYNHLVLCIV